MTRVRLTGFAALGAGLIAISYGLARFAYGLFVPLIREDLGLSPQVMGVIGALAFMSYVLAILAAPLTAQRLGPRGIAVVSAAFAAVGTFTIANAHGAPLLALGVLVCGVSTGLMSPAMTAAVQAATRPALHSRLNAIINAGTSIGVAAAVPAVFLGPGAWRGAYQAFAVSAGIGLVAAWLYLPARAHAVSNQPAGGAPITAAQWRSLAALAAFAFAMGVICAPYWVFAPDLAVTLGGVSASRAALIWLAVGVGGLAGGMTGDLVARYGIAMTHGFALASLAAALALLAASPGTLALTLISAAVFGAAYMTLTGLYVVGGVGILPDRPAMGPVVPFASLAVGQALGSPLAGSLIGHLGYPAAFGCFTALGLGAALTSPLLPQRPAAPDVTLSPDAPRVSNVRAPRGADGRSAPGTRA